MGENAICSEDREPYFIYSATLGTEVPTEHKASGDTSFDEAEIVCKRGTWKPSKGIPTVQEFRWAGYDEKEVVVLNGLEGMMAYRMTARDGQ